MNFFCKGIDDLFNKILAAIDDSKVSKKVLEVAINLIKKSSGELFLISSCTS